MMRMRGSLMSARWKYQPEAAAAAGFAFHLSASFVSVHDVAHQEQAQAIAAFAASVGRAIEAVENLLLLGGSDPKPWSSTSKITLPLFASSRTAMSRDEPEYFTALSSRLTTAWDNAAASNRTGGAESASTRRTLKPARSRYSR